MKKYKSEVSVLEKECKGEPSEMYKLVDEMVNRRTRAAFYSEEKKKIMD
jgi:hypothetical protein